MLGRRGGPYYITLFSIRKQIQSFVKMVNVFVSVRNRLFVKMVKVYFRDSTVNHTRLVPSGSFIYCFKIIATVIKNK
jgi:hypothetical protein